MLELHRLSEQVLLPLTGARRCVLLLAPAALVTPRFGDGVALLKNGYHGMPIAAGTWHNRLLALGDGPWLVLERRGAAVDCEAVALDGPLRLTL